MQRGACRGDGGVRARLTPRSLLLLSLSLSLSLLLLLSLSLSLLLLIPYPEPPAVSLNPKGGVHGCTPFSDRAMDGESENPRRDSAADGGFVGEGPFFGYFLWPFKESNPPKGGSF